MIPERRFSRLLDRPSTCGPTRSAPSPRTALSEAGPRMAPHEGTRRSAALRRCSTEPSMRLADPSTPGLPTLCHLAAGTGPTPPTVRSGTCAQIGLPLRRHGSRWRRIRSRATGSGACCGRSRGPAASLHRRADRLQVRERAAGRRRSRRRRARGRALGDRGRRITPCLHPRSAMPVPQSSTAHDETCGRSATSSTSILTRDRGCTVDICQAIGRRPVLTAEHDGRDRGRRRRRMGRTARTALSAAP